ncbi:hypothetical protein EV360DRAFT_84665 [Lentinula raphanica]|nr:hypothetical protein EV360DRAFT_84665 [Lentinula raphanica]
MVHSRPVFIFVALGAASIATAAPLRLAPSVEPARQEAASCAYEIELNVSSGEHHVLDMNSFPSRRDSSGIDLLLPFDSPSSQDDDTSVLSIASRAVHPSGLFVSPSSQERADADHTASVPDIASHAPHPSGPFQSLLILEDHADTDDTSAPSIESRAPRPSGPFHSPSIEERVDDATASVPSVESHAPYPSAPFHSLAIQKRADADDAASFPGVESRAPHTSGGLLQVVRRSIGVPSSGTSNTPDTHPLLRKRTDTDIAGDDDNRPLALHIPVTLQPTSAAALPDQHNDAREQGDTIIAALRIASHVPDSSGPLHPSAVSVAHTLVQEHTPTDIASAHSIEPRSSVPPGPLVVSSDMNYLSSLGEQASAEEVVNVIKSHSRSYETDIQGTETWSQFLETTSGRLWQDIERLLRAERPNIIRRSVKIEIMKDIILASPESNNPNSLLAYKKLMKWNYGEYGNAIAAYDKWNDIKHLEIGRLIYRIKTCLKKGQPAYLPNFMTMVHDDINGLTTDRKAKKRIETIIRDPQHYADLRDARGAMSQFASLNLLCYQQYQYLYDNSLADVAGALYNRMEQALKTWHQHGHGAVAGAAI